MGVKSHSTNPECNTRTRIKTCCARPATETIMTVRSIESSNVHSKLSVNNVSATSRFQPLAPLFYSPSHPVCFFLSAKSCDFDIFQIQVPRCSGGSHLGPRQLTKLHSAPQGRAPAFCSRNLPGRDIHDWIWFPDARVQFPILSSSVSHAQFLITIACIWLGGFPYLMTPQGRLSPYFSHMRASLTPLTD